MTDPDPAACGPVEEAFRVAIGSGRIFVRLWRVHGRRAPIVLLHDSLGAVALWRDFPRRLALATGRSVIAYDRLGFGASDPHPGRLAKGFVQDEAAGPLAALLDQLGINGFVACGHSVGGGMAVAAAAAWPGRCRALVTLSAQAFVEDRTLDGIRRAQTLFAQGDQFDRLKKYHGDKAAWVLDAWIGTWLSPAFLDWTLDRELAAVRCPALLLHGDQDDYGTLRHPRHMSALIPAAATVELLPDCGHVPHRERPEAVIAAVAGFLAPID